MGLDQRLTWIGKISDDEKEFLWGKEAYPQRSTCSNNGTIHLYDLGIAEINEKEFNIKQHKYTKSLLTPVKMLVRETDWDRVKKDCNVPENARLWGLGPHHVRYGDASGNCEEYRINLFGGDYDILVERTLYLYHSIELYRWRNNYDIQKLFNDTYPDAYDEYKKKYEIEYGGFYPIGKLLEEMRKIDAKFAEQYCGIIQSVFYDADW